MTDAERESIENLVIAVGNLQELLFQSGLETILKYHPKYKEVEQALDAVNRSLT